MFEISFSIFFVFVLDRHIRLYDTSTSQTFRNLSNILVNDVGWAILDTAVSPDRNSIAYSTWSDCSKSMNNKSKRNSIILFFSLFG